MKNYSNMAAEGKIDVLEDLKEPIDLCLGCRACEIACPVNVPYGSILEHAKEKIHDQETRDKKNNRFKDFDLYQLFMNRKAMKFSGDMYHLYQKSGIQKVVRSTNLPEKLVNNIGSFEKSLPTVPSKKYQIERGNSIKQKQKILLKPSRYSFDV